MTKQTIVVAVSLICVMPIQPHAASNTKTDESSLLGVASNNETAGADSSQPPLRTLEENDKFRKKYTFTEEERARREWERFSRAREAGASEMRIFRMQEVIAIENGMYRKVDCFETWMKQYNGEILKDESFFNILEPFEYDFTSPWNAIRSYWRGLVNSDAEVILRHSDPSFISYLEKHRKRSLLNDPKRFNNDGLNKVVPLLTGTCVMGGKKYTMLFYRREALENPELNRISFRWQFVVFLNGSYHLSEAPAMSQFGNMVEAMKLGFVYPSGKYNYLREKLKETAMPEAFYFLQNKEKGSSHQGKPGVPGL